MNERTVLLRVNDRRQTFNAAVAKIAHKDLWRCAGPVPVSVGPDQRQGDREPDAAVTLDVIERVELISRLEPKPCFSPESSA